MQNQSTKTQTQSADRTGISLWLLTGCLALAFVVGAILTSILMSFARSTGLSEIKVTALEESAEPRDHDLPFINQKEALPDYKITVNLSNGRRIQLGTKLDTSAVDGLVWPLNELVNIDDVASIKLVEEDKLVSDAIAEVKLQGDSTTEGAYRFDFVYERSFALGVKSFFASSIGVAITSAFSIALLLLILSVFHP